MHQPIHQIDYNREDEDTLYVYMVYDEDNTLVNVYNEYMDAITYCVEELKNGDEEVVLDLYEFACVVESSKGMYSVIAEVLVNA